MYSVISVIDKKTTWQYSKVDNCPFVASAISPSLGGRARGQPLSSAPIYYTHTHYIYCTHTHLILHQYTLSSTPICIESMNSKDHDATQCRIHRFYAYGCCSDTATHYNTMQHTATLCDTLQQDLLHYYKITLQHTAIHCNATQHTATHCNTLQPTATHCNRTYATNTVLRLLRGTSIHCKILQTHHNTLQRTVTHRNTMQHTATLCNALQYTEMHCNTLQHTAAHCSTLQHTAAHCSTLQNTATHTATHCNTTH